MPFFIEKNFQQKIYFCLLKMRSIVFKRENPIFSIKLGPRLPKSFFSTSCKNFKIFPFILFEKRRLAQGIRQPKAVDSPLYISEWIGINMIGLEWISIRNFYQGEQSIAQFSKFLADHAERLGNNSEKFCKF